MSHPRPGDVVVVRALVTAVLDRHDRIDAFINSAGVVSYGRVEDVPPSVFEGVLRTNLVGSVVRPHHRAGDDALRAEQVGRARTRRATPSSASPATC